MIETKYNYLNWPICDSCKHWDWKNATTDIFDTLWAKCKLKKEPTSETSSCNDWEHYKEEGTD